MYYAHISKINNTTTTTICQFGHFYFDQVDIFQEIETARMFHNNGLAIWHSFTNICILKNKYRWSGILPAVTLFLHYSQPFSNSSELLEK